MKLDLLINKAGLHHAYCILGDSECIVDELKSVLEKDLKFNIKNNPDFWYGEFDVMDVGDSRSIKELHQKKPTLNDKKFFILTANFITEKAQNAMLKLFEEPRGDTHFFLVLPSLNNILPTLRSRLFIVDAQTVDDSVIDAKSFLAMPVGKRIESVKELCEAISDEEESKIAAAKFINSLETELRKKIKIVNNKKDEIKIFEEIEKLRQYALDQSPSLKMILEHISIMLPVLK